MNFKLIKIRMIEKGYNLKELAELLDVNINTISRWVNGNNINQIEKFIELCKILNIEIEEL